MKLVALFVSEDTFEAALESVNGSVISQSFLNTELGIDELLTWLVTNHGDQAEPQWVMTVPVDSGGYIYQWLSENAPEYFLQNPTALKKYAEINAMQWDTANTLYLFNASKAW